MPRFGTKFPGHGISPFQPNNRLDWRENLIFIDVSHFVTVKTMIPLNPKIIFEETEMKHHILYARTIIFNWRDTKTQNAGWLGISLSLPLYLSSGSQTDDLGCFELAIDNRHLQNDGMGHVACGMRHEGHCNLIICLSQSWPIGDRMQRRCSTSTSTDDRRIVITVWKME